MILVLNFVFTSDIHFVKYLLQQGQTGISVAMDLPTQLGYDSDNPLAAGEVGNTGVAIDSLRDMEILFEGIPLEKLVRIATSANAIGPIFGHDHRYR